MTATTTKSDPKKPKKLTPAERSRRKKIAVGTGVVVAGAVAAAVFFMGGDANASNGKKGGGGGGDSSGGGSPGGKGSAPGKAKGKGKKPKKKPGKNTKKKPEGYFWGDESLIPDDFDWTGNKIYFAENCGAIAVGYWFLAEGTDADGNASGMTHAELYANSQGKADKLREPKPNSNGVPHIFGPLSETDTMTVYAWLADYWETRLLEISDNEDLSTEEFLAAKAWPNLIRESIDSLFEMASLGTGGTNCQANRDLWTPAVFDFHSLMLQRATEFQAEVYGNVGGNS